MMRRTLLVLTFGLFLGASSSYACGGGKTCTTAKGKKGSVACMKDGKCTESKDGKCDMKETAMGGKCDMKAHGKSKHSCGAKHEASMKKTSEAKG